MNMKKIAIYSDIGELIETECPEYVNNVEPEVMEFLHGVNDFEPLSFMVVNDNIVVTYDIISGDVIGQTAIAEFIDESVDYGRKEIEQ